MSRHVLPGGSSHGTFTVDAPPRTPTTMFDLMDALGVESPRDIRLIERLVVDPGRAMSDPHFYGTRIPVEATVEMLLGGVDVDELHDGHVSVDMLCAGVLWYLARQTGRNPSSSG
eukprot:TRINITY_DN5178_c0_g1_i1.p2 TRINITY_DN5178_c0_g1~~TRINITY_DN5178_c0_g1_i1.p2  ORF type:complete len:115 (-),score=19.64 TRINITY_DN5178_c0_g1_i1:116-460(-)